MNDAMDGEPVVAGRIGSRISSSVTVGEMPVGIEILLRDPESDERRRMKRPARDFFLSLLDFVSSPEPEPSVPVGDSALSRSLLKDDRRLLMERRCDKDELFW